MSRESVIAGQLRELGVILFLFLSTFGVIGGHTVTAWSSAFAAVGILIIAIRSPRKDGWGKMTTLVRKAIGGVAGVLAAYAILKPEQLEHVEALMALVPLVIPLVWSYVEKTDSPGGGSTALLVLGVLSLATFLPSCTPQSYIVDVRDYTAQIEAHPGEVIMSPEDVEPVGGFTATVGARLITDHGEIDLSNDGVQGDIFVDLRSK